MNVYVIVFAECCAAALALFVSLIILSSKEKDARRALRQDITEWMRYENASVAELATYGETCSGSRAQVQRELDAARYIVKCLKAKLAARTRRDICF